MQSRRAWPQLTHTQTLLGIVLCFIVAVLAQQSLDRYAAPFTPWALLATLGLAGIAFAILTRHNAVEASTDQERMLEPATSFHLLSVLLAISVLGCLNFGGNRFRMPGVLLWCSGLLLALLYLWLISSGPRAGSLLRTWRERRKVWVPAHALALAALVLLGAWFRLYRLSEIPVEMGFDLASKYFDSLAIARGEYSIFFPARLGREGLFFYSVALLGRFAGITRATLHLTTALYGTLTIVVVYFLAQELLRPPAGLLAAFLLATNRWHIVLSRSGFRAATMPLFTALAFYAFVRALRTRRPVDFGLAGVTVGMGIYSYRSFLFVPVAMTFGLLLHRLTRGREELHALVPGLLIMAFIATAIAAPLARYAVENPDRYLARERYQVQAMAKQETRSPGMLVYYARSLLAFNYRGEADSRFSLPYVRQMGLASGVLLAMGLAYTLWHWRQGYNALVLAALCVLILPAALSMLPDEMPSALRLSGAIVPAVVLAAVPIVAVQQAADSRQPSPKRSRQSRQEHGTEYWHRDLTQTAELHRTEAEEEQQSNTAAFGVALSVQSGSRERTWTWPGPRRRAAQWALAITVVLTLAHETSEARQYYFHDYVQRLPEMSNYSVPWAIAREIKQYGDLQSVYIRTWPNWFDSSALRLHVGVDQSWNPFVDTLAADQPPLATIERPALFILNVHDEESLATLRAFLPRNISRVHMYPNGELAFITFLGER